MDRPDLKDLLDARLEGNQRFQALLKDPEGIEHHVDASYDLIAQMETALDRHPFLAGPSYSLADCFATAALARFTIHGFAERWQDTSVADYYERIKARPSFSEAEVIDTGTERDL